MALNSYSALQTSIADWLNRDDLTAVIPDFITLAESKFKRDRRARKLIDRGTFTVTADGDSLPSSLQSIESWYHDGPANFFALKVVTANALAAAKNRLGGDATGVPQYVAIVDGVVRYAPEPNDTYETQITYWGKVDPLTSGSPNNWLLDNHPDIYLFGSLMMAAPYLKEDQRVQTWEHLYDTAMEELNVMTDNEQFGGRVVQVTRRPIGG